MKSISKIIFPLLIALILISCDEDSGTNAPNGYRETGDRIKTVLISTDGYPFRLYNRAEYKYNANGTLDEIHLHYKEGNLGYMSIVTPEYNGTDTNYVFRNVDTMGGQPGNPSALVAVSWSGETRYISYYLIYPTNGVDDAKADYTMQTVYKNGRMVENNITVPSSLSTTDILHEYKYSYADSVTVDYTRTIVGNDEYQARLIYTMHVNDAPNPLELLNILGAYGTYDINITLNSNNLIDSFNEDFIYVDYETGNEEIWPQPEKNYIYEYSAKGNLTNMSGPMISDSVPFDVLRETKIKIEWE